MSQVAYVKRTRSHSAGSSAGSDLNGTSACYQSTYEKCFQCKHSGRDAARLRMPVFQNSPENAAKASNDSDST